MPLSDTQVRSFKPRERAYKKSDAKGLFLLIKPNGSKLWRFKFHFGGKEKSLSFGPYPDVSLADAREKRDEARRQIYKGEDPATKKQLEKVQSIIDANNTFAEVAEEYIETKLVMENKAPATIIKNRWALNLLRPAIGSRPISEIEPAELLAALKKFEQDGHREKAHKCRTFAGSVFRYGVATSRCKTDPSALLKGALATQIVKHHAAILDPVELGKFLNAIDLYEGSPITMHAMQLAPHVFVRPGELRHAQWPEINWENSVWELPSGKMKSRRPHQVPLSKQSLAILEHVREITGAEQYVFPSLQTGLKPMSENTLNVAFRRMGYTKDEITAHGLRTTASSLLNESGKWNPDAIEAALSHKTGHGVRAIYNRSPYWDERVRMMQWWSDYLCQIKTARKDDTI